MILETKRLILRRPKRSDWKELIDGLNDKSIRESMSGIPYPYRKKDAFEWIKKTDRYWKKKQKDNYAFHIVLKEENKVIGGIGIGSLDKQNGNGTTGSWINAKYRRKGYITEAKIAINDLAFNKLKLRRLNSNVIYYNSASRKVQEKIGYKLEGIRKEYLKLKSNGEIVDLCVYGLLKKDWKEVKRKLIKYIERKS